MHAMMEGISVGEACLCELARLTLWMHLCAAWVWYVSESRRRKWWLFVLKIASQVRSC